MVDDRPGASQPAGAKRSSPYPQRPPGGLGLRQALQKAWHRLSSPNVVLGLLVLSLVALPFAMVASLNSAAARQMGLEADGISTLASGIRTYYSDNVISRIQASGGKAVATDNYREVHGGIPIPATLSIELGALYDSAPGDGRIRYDFLSDYPFAGRISRPLDPFEREALDAFRKDPGLERFTRLEPGFLGPGSFRLATPVTMRQACVSCHNSHPDSPRRTWKVGDVRGLQEVTIRSPRLEGFGHFGYLVGYVGLVGLASVGVAGSFQRQAGKLERINRRLVESNERETWLTEQLSQQVDELSLLGAVVDNATFGVSIADMRVPDAPLVYVNEAFCRITGYGKREAAGLNCRFLRGEGTDPEASGAIAQAIRQGLPCEREILNYRRDGTPFWNRLTLYPVGGTPGRPDFYVGNQVDVTALRNLRGEDACPSLEREGREALQACREVIGFLEELQARLADLEALTPQLVTRFQSEQEQLRSLVAQLEASLPGPASEATGGRAPAP
ncbi:MAG: PAS domain-containing protein [Prochlorococcaceae cyanobacterium]|jgi:PAS domain S-box-containing protein